MNVIERPEFVSGASDEELAEYVEAEIPLKITGSLSLPIIRPDIGKMLEDRITDEARDKVLEKLLGDDAPEEGEDVEDAIKDAVGDKLKDLFKKKKNE